MNVSNVPNQTARFRANWPPADDFVALFIPEDR
jgi:hypothetical protein